MLLGYAVPSFVRSMAYGAAAATAGAATGAAAAAPFFLPALRDMCLNIS